jgi:hypothetical protein
MDSRAEFFTDTPCYTSKIHGMTILDFASPPPATRPSLRQLITTTLTLDFRRLTTSSVKLTISKTSLALYASTSKPAHPANRTIHFGINPTVNYNLSSHLITLFKLSSSI